MLATASVRLSREMDRATEWGRAVLRSGCDERPEVGMLAIASVAVRHPSQLVAAAPDPVPVARLCRLCRTLTAAAESRPGWSAAWRGVICCDEDFHGLRGPRGDHSRCDASGAPGVHPMKVMPRHSSGPTFRGAIRRHRRRGGAFGCRSQSWRQEFDDDERRAGAGRAVRPAGERPAPGRRLVPVGSLRQRAPVGHRPRGLQRRR